MPMSHRKERGFKHDAEERLKDRGSGHDAKEPPKIYGIRTQCQRATEMKGDPGIVPKSHKKERGSVHDAEEPSKR